MRAALDAGNIKRNSQAFIEAFFRNDATVGGIITGRSQSAAYGGSSVPLTEADRQKIIEQWNAQTKGARKGFKTMMLPWDLSYERMGGNPPTDQIELTDDQRRNIHQVFKVPMSMTQASDASDPLSSGATISKDEAKFLSQWAMPEHKRLLKWLNVAVMPWLAPGLELVGDYTDVLGMISDTAERRDMFRADLEAGAITVNEYRESIGKKEFEDGDVLYMPSGTVVVPVDSFTTVDAPIVFGQQPEPQFEDRPIDPLPEVEPEEPPPLLPEGGLSISPKMEIGEGGDCIMGFISDTGSIRRVQDTLRAAMGDDIELTPPDSFHITMIYTHKPMPDELRDKMPFEDISSFPVVVTGIDTFDTSDGYAIHLVIGKGGMLSVVQEYLHSQLAEQADAVELSEFSIPGSYNPHITLGYSDKPFEVKPITPFSLLVDSIQLTNGDHDIIREVELKAFPPPEPNKARSLIIAEYEAWRKFLVKRIKAGKSEFREFNIEMMPDEWALEMKAALQGVTDIGEINTLFNDAIEEHKTAQSRLLEFERKFRAWMNAMEKGDISGAAGRRRLQNDWRVSGTQMFTEGLIDGGRLDGKLTKQERKQLNKLVTAATPFIRKLGDNLSAGVLTKQQKEQRVTSWGQTFMQFYQDGLTSANKDQLLLFTGKDGTENCRTCKVLKGQVHTAGEWKERELRPGIDHHNFECGTWDNCHHILTPVDGKAKGELPSREQVRTWAAKTCTHDHIDDAPPLEEQPYTLEQFDKYWETNGHDPELIGVTQ
jgi:2'-5' RNA ligase